MAVSFLDDIKGKAEELIGGNTDAVKDGIEKAGDFVDEKTGGKFADQVNGVQQAASDYVSGLGQGNAPAEPATDAVPAGAAAAEGA
ncbi:hypothetical protein SCMU_18940 [Sinomonas cyclohexanicum]|uniref:MT0933-like antitoxin protein n=1 Tax=Sinomonas cyclohexanicum TaxID=322009 RepID=A0ABM7PUW6_SINCY|nr:hypothetical protein SCMU_18940 [Corynebacterium cyclohexanicum]